MIPDRGGADELVEDRPDGPDWYWFLRDLANALKRHGFTVGSAFTYESVINHPNFKGDPTPQGWAKHYFSAYLDLTQLEKDWRGYLHGRKALSNFSIKYCSDQLIRGEEDSKFPGSSQYRTGPNAHALSQSLQDVLSDEKERYKSRSVARMKELDVILRNQDWVRPILAAERIGCSTRWIRNLACQGKLERVDDNTGRIRSRSVHDYLRSQKRRIYS